MPDNFEITSSVLNGELSLNIFGNSSYEFDNKIYLTINAFNNNIPIIKPVETSFYLTIYDNKYYIIILDATKRENENIYEFDHVITGFVGGIYEKENVPNDSNQYNNLITIKPTIKYHNQILEYSDSGTTAEIDKFYIDNKDTLFNYTLKYSLIEPIYRFNINRENNYVHNGRGICVFPSGYYHYQNCDDYGNPLYNDTFNLFTFIISRQNNIINYPFEPKTNIEADPVSAIITANFIYNTLEFTNNYENNILTGFSNTEYSFTVLSNIKPNSQEKFLNSLAKFYPNYSLTFSINGSTTGLNAELQLINSIETDEPEYFPVYNLILTGKPTFIGEGTLIITLNAYNTLDNVGLPICKTETISINFKFFQLVDENPPQIRLKKNIVNFHTIKDFTFEEKDLSSLVKIENMSNDITSSWLTYQLKEFDNSKNEYKAIDSFNGFYLDSKTGKTKGIGETYSDYVETKYIEFTLHYIKNEIEYTLNPILQEISILVGAYFGIVHNAFENDKVTPTLFAAESPTVLKSLIDENIKLCLNTSNDITITFDGPETLNINLLNKWVLYYDTLTADNVYCWQTYSSLFNNCTMHHKDSFYLTYTGETGNASFNIIQFKYYVKNSDELNGTYIWNQQATPKPVFTHNNGHTITFNKLDNQAVQGIITNVKTNTTFYTDLGMYGIDSIPCFTSEPGFIEYFDEEGENYVEVHNIP